MIKKTIERINRKLKSFFEDKNALSGIDRISPNSLKYIKEFSLRDGKRIRPLLFILAYLGFAKKKAGNFYNSAIALELIHAFILMHDDIVDRAGLRRGLPSLHKVIGNEKAMLIGDILYALGIKAFFSIREEPLRKEKALNMLLEAAVHTGCGEMNELILSRKGIDKIKLLDIYSIYELKTSYYTFMVPLMTGAVLAGAKNSTIEHLKGFGGDLGRAFQIKDDLLGLLSDENTTGKSALTDLVEKKMTAPLVYTYRHSGNKAKMKIREVLKKKIITRKDLMEIRKLVFKARTVQAMKTVTDSLLKNAKKKLLLCGIKGKYAQALLQLCGKM